MVFIQHNRPNPVHMVLTLSCSSVHTDLLLWTDCYGSGYVQVSPMSDTDLLETYDSDSGYILVSPASHTYLLLVLALGMHRFFQCLILISSRLSYSSDSEYV